jgi:hypothetical protein
MMLHKLHATKTDASEITKIRQTQNDGLDIRSFKNKDLTSSGGISKKYFSLKIFGIFCIF